ncbi:Malto-oligosyltrehalose trehalohydrolase [Rhodovulum sp. PH10]|uniref:malto-oligosyltrehalose trehalohydrolase n=1 Tax=Rhodovulum sp. PH10 TaxID=1187851 RepID=UPI00027C1FFC|nr:malto-oligosyltrehalose trehalohydrolase [Rhodovulum sp. PH10]EJW12414.1 Malto-oligosyltrehalose trehalohydrolase [Rhodovulum sp. PH10]
MTTATRFGPILDADGGVTFRLWAPAATSVDLVTATSTPMRRDATGWYEARIAGARAGTHYAFRIDGDLVVPDPASAFQPHDVTGASEVVDHRAFAWSANDWKGRPWREAVILELHVGTFTAAGTFRAVIDRLDDVIAAGFTAIELMPVADFPGRWNWGYDGVLWYAPDSAYGRPEDLKALVDAAHQKGLMVFLDVVYNHFGPEGNYLGRYAPAFFTENVHTPWGAAIDYAVPEVRAFAIENAVFWLENYRFDGLRLDAVHAIGAPGEPSVLVDLSRAVGELAARTGRHIHLVLENDDNAAWLLDPAPAVPDGKYRAQWNDDYHHAWHVLLTGERQGYYVDYADDPRRHLARVLASGFAYQGEASPHRKGVNRGEPSADLPPAAFVSFLQNHDQIGNRAHGDRLDGLASDALAVEAALAVLLLAPMPPLMFMGEEWGSDRPFPFFCDFAGDLAEAVRQGRRREFAEAYRDQTTAGEVPDPLTEATVRSAVLDWPTRGQPAHRKRLDFVSTLLKLRRERVVPHIAEGGGKQGGKQGAGGAEVTLDGAVLTARWALDGGTLALIANLAAEPATAPEAAKHLAGGAPLFGPPPASPGATLAPWSVSWSWRAA